MQKEKKKRKKNSIIKYNPKYTKARLLYCRGSKKNGSGFSIKEIALHFNILEKTLYQISSKENWRKLRNNFLNNVDRQMEKISEKEMAEYNIETVKKLREIIGDGLVGIVDKYKKDENGIAKEIMTISELDKMVRLERMFNGNGIDISNEVIVDLQKDVSEFTMEELAEVKRNLDREIEKSNAIDVSSYEE